MIVAGTGHRPPVLFTENYYSDENRKILKDFARWRIPLTTIKVISGMAQGWDQALAEAAIDLQIPFIAALPFEGMEAKWPKESRDRFDLILSKAEKVHIVCEGGYANAKFYERDKWMVDNCDLVLALYNGNPTGGTAITVKYTNQINKPIHNVWDEWIKYNV